VGLVTVVWTVMPKEYKIIIEIIRKYE
jgi:hypothetical protein